MRRVKPGKCVFAEMAGNYQGFAGYSADIPLDGLDGNMMHEDYAGSMAYERQPYNEPY